MVWHVFEKKSEMYALSVLKENPHTAVDYTGPVFDVRSEACHLYRHPNGKWYSRGVLTDFTDLLFPQNPELDGRFIGVDYNDNQNFCRSCQGERGFAGFRNPDTYVFHLFFDGGEVIDFNQVIGAMRYAMEVKADLSRCTVQGFSMECKDTGMWLLADLFGRVAEDAARQDTEPNAVVRLMSLSGMRLSELSAALGVPYRTMQNWKLGYHECPAWAVPLFELKLLLDGVI